MVVGYHLAAFAGEREGALGRPRRSVQEAVAQINTYLRDAREFERCPNASPVLLAYWSLLSVRNIRN
jgi:hypothetical protein